MENNTERYNLAPGFSTIMSKAEKTRQYIIEKTAPIFNTKGFAGTSLSDLTEATGLTKGSIYGNFANKEEVALEVFKYNVGLVSQNMRADIRTHESSLDKLTAVFDFYRKNWKRLYARGGCAILNSAVEADDNLPFLKKSVQNSVKNFADNLVNIIDYGKKRNEIKKNIDSRAYAYTIITLIEGGVLMGKISNGPDLLFAALDRAQLIINQEMKK